MQVGYLKRDQMERFVNKPNGGTRAWFVSAWRIVDDKGDDIIQPWCRTAREARETAAACDIELRPL